MHIGMEGTGGLTQLFLGPCFQASDNAITAGPPKTQWSNGINMNITL